MRVRMDFRDEATDIFDKFTKLNWGLVKEGLSKASYNLADEYKKVLKAEAPSDWGAMSENGKRRLTLNEKKDRFGDKYSRKTGERIMRNGWQSGNIADHITWYTPKNLESLYAVVGGGHKGFHPIDYLNGIATGYRKIQIGEKSKNEWITATSNETLDILDKLNDGATIVLTKRQKKLIGKTKKGSKSLNIAPDIITFKPRRFAEKARALGGDRALASLVKMYEEQFPKAMNNMKPKVYTRSTA